MANSQSQAYPGGTTETGSGPPGDAPTGYPSTIVASFRAFEFASVIAEEHGHATHDGDEACEHPLHTLQALAGAATAVHINDAISRDEFTFDRIRHDLNRLGMTEREVMAALAIFADWQERQP